MLKNYKKQSKSQSILDFVLIFGILITFLAGLTRVWIWFNANYAKRNVDYQNTRLAAGTASDSHLSNLAYSDQLLKIDDNWVFKGQASGNVGMPPTAAYSTIDALSGEANDGSELACSSAKEAATSLRTEAKNMDGQADKIRDFTDWADSWALEWLFELIGVDVDGMVEAAEALEENADLVREKANEIEEAGCNQKTME